MADDFAKEVRELLAQAEEADRDNREEAITDLKFEAGDQWHEGVRRDREAQNLPCPTINVAQQYTAQVVGDWRANQTSIRVLPREDGDVKVAEVRSELIRSIELQSKSDRIYASSLAQMVACGISNFRVDIEDAIENPFLRDIFIRDIPNPLAVWWDPLASDPTGRDATYCFVGDEISTAEYKRRYPKAALASLISHEAGSNWCDGKTVQLPEYWKIIEKPRTFGMKADGSTVDLTGIDQKQWPQLAIDEKRQPIVREKVKCKYAVRQMTNGMEPLDDPYELKVHRLPIIRVMGREGLNEGRKVRYGLLRFMRDPILMRNHNLAIRAELLMRFPRANFIGPASAIEGREGDWENYLAFNDSTTAPVEITGRNLGALLAEDQIYNQALRDVTGIHEASMGMPSNETSGKAIVARQHEGDIATIVYRDNMLAAQQEAGEVINAYIPTVFDTARTIRTVGADLATKMVRVNDQADPESVDLGLGKYDVTVATGPAYMTRRQQAVDAMMQLIQARPDLASIIGDLVVGAMDIPEADKIMERIKRTIPPQVLGDDADDGKSEEEVQAQQQKAQEAEQKEQMGMMLQMRAQAADTELKEAQAAKAKAEAMKALSEAQNPAAGASPPDPALAMQELRLKSALADKAEAEAAAAQASAMVAVAGLGGSADPEADRRLQIEAYNAITKRIVAMNPHILQANEPANEPDTDEGLAA